MRSAYGGVRMPALPKIEIPVPEFVTLPQSLRWIVDEEQPVPLTHEVIDPTILPYTPEGDTPLQDLYRALVSGILNLYGRRGIEPEPSYDNNFFFSGVECKGFEPIGIVPTDAIGDVGFDGIDWRQSFMYKKVYNGEFGPELISGYWTELRINWRQLYTLTTGQRFPEQAICKATSSLPAPVLASTFHQPAHAMAELSGVAPCLSLPSPTPAAAGDSRDEAGSEEASRGRGRAKRDDWPMIAALIMLIEVREPGLIDPGTGKIPSLTLAQRIADLLQAAGYSPVDCGQAPARSSIDKQASPHVTKAKELYEAGCRKKPGRG